VIQPGWRRVDPRLTVVDGALALLVVIVIVQVWLLTASLESFLAGHDAVVLPAAIVSGVLLSAAAGLIAVIGRTERRGPGGDRQRR
jgi:hypothetical protein